MTAADRAALSYPGAYDTVMGEQWEATMFLLEVWSTIEPWLLAEGHNLPGYGVILLILLVASMMLEKHAAGPSRRIIFVAQMSLCLLAFGLGAASFVISPLVHTATAG